MRAPEFNFDFDPTCLHLLPALIISLGDDEDGNAVGTIIIVGVLFWQLAIVFPDDGS